MKIVFSKAISETKRNLHRKGWEGFRKDVKAENSGRHTLCRLTKPLATYVFFFLRKVKKNKFDFWGVLIDRVNKTLDF